VPKLEFFRARVPTKLKNAFIQPIFPGFGRFFGGEGR
jgi:hypothetical protein